MIALGLDIGSNSVGSAWVDAGEALVVAGTSIFPAGVNESDDKRGDPKNAVRRMARRARITLARRAQRKRELRLKLIEARLLPPDQETFYTLLDQTNPWDLRNKGLSEKLDPHEFGRVLLHLAQRRGALGLKLGDMQDAENNPAVTEDGKVKAAITELHRKMKACGARTFGQYIAMEQAKRVTPITSQDRRPVHRRKGQRIHRDPIRNRAESYEHCADRNLIREEFNLLWDKQKSFDGPTARLLTDELRKLLDDESGDAVWRHKGLLFGQRRQTWDLGTLGRCTLHPTERCIAHADRHASQYLVAETLNNLRVVEPGLDGRSLTVEEYRKLRDYLRGPLGMETPKKKRGEKTAPAPRPKRTVNVGDLREQMGWSRRAGKMSTRFNIEKDEDRPINTDWFHREIVHGAVTLERWEAMDESIRKSLNRAILKHDPDDERDAEKLRAGVIAWADLNEAQADALIAAWKTRPRPEARRLNLSRRAVRNLLTLMDPADPMEDMDRPGHVQCFTEIRARKTLAEDADFKDVTTGQPFDDATRQRYNSGTKGATARDRYYMRKHVLCRDGQPIIDPVTNKPLAEPPPAPLISNPVVRKAIHEVRRHLVTYMTRFGRKPDEVYVELSREARMGAKDADRALFLNRLRNRIRHDIITHHGLESYPTSQQRVSVVRVILAVQQDGLCPLCGNTAVPQKITPAMAAHGQDCELAHIIPRASGGHNGLGNLVLAHTKCNRDMGRRTPRQYWHDFVKGGYEEGMRWVEGIYGDIQRPKYSEIKKTTGNSLWQCYFNKRDDGFKIKQFTREIKDIQNEMTQRQDAATKYATRQVMAYLADALFDGGGLPERGGDRRIFATDGMWTSRLRREWGLFFDPHNKKAKGLDDKQEHMRKEKDRGDHRHHAIDAVIVALSRQQVRNAWDQREQRASVDGVNTADESLVEIYRRNNPLPAPGAFKDRETFRQSVRQAVFGNGDLERPVCHRAVKRKIIGPLHEMTLFGLVLDRQGNLTGLYTAKKSVLSLTPKHLRLPRPETEEEAVNRLAKRRQREKTLDEKAAREWASQVVSSKGYRPLMVDPPPEKSGLVRDIALRRAIRDCLESHGMDPDNFSKTDIKRLCPLGDPSQWKLRLPSGVPVKSVVLLRTMNEPVVMDRKQPDYTTGKMLPDPNPASRRAYLGGNNHHIEIRENAKGRWTGQVVSTFDVAQRKLARLRAFRQAGIPRPDAFRKLSKADRKRLHPTIAAIEKAHPLVDRRDDAEKGGRFIMSLCEGETLMMRHKQTGQLGYFVVAKLDRPQSIVVVPHWDARSATPRKDADGNKVPDSSREHFTVTPGDLKTLAPPDHTQAVKVRVDPLGEVQVVQED